MIINSRKVVAVGLLDNDCLALLMMQRMIANRDLNSTLLWSTRNATVAIQHCRYDRCKPDVVIVDMALDGVSGDIICREIRMNSAVIALLGVTSYPLDMYRVAIARAGAQALVDKQELQRSLPVLLHVLADGQPYPFDDMFVDTHTAYCSLHARLESTDQHLSARERQIIDMYRHNVSTAEVARLLHVSQNTIYSHRRNIKRRLGVSTWPEIVNTYNRKFGYS